MISRLSIPESTTSSQPAAIGLGFVVGFFFSFRVMLVLLSVRLLGVDPRTGAGLSVGLNLLLLVVVGFHSLGEVQNSLGEMLRLTGVRWVLGFLAFSGCSLLWSSTASLPAAMAFWCAMAADVAMVALLLRSHPMEEVVSSLLKGFVCGACVVAAIAWVMPAQSDMRLGDEELLGPNQIGYVCAFAVFLAQYLLRHKEGKWGLATLFLAVTVLRSLSKTTILALLVAECFLLLQDKSMSRKTKIWLGVAALVVVLAFWGLLSAYFDTYTSGTDPESLTGRVGIWTVVLEAALTQPWIGHGFHSVWKVIPPFGPDFFEARHAHNELLQQFYAYGVAGIVLLAGVYASLYRQLRSLPKSPWRTFLLGMLLFVLVRGLADTEAFDLSLPLWFILLASVSTDRVRQLSEEVTQPDAGPELDTGFAGVSTGLPTA